MKKKLILELKKYQNEGSYFFLLTREANNERQVQIKEFSTQRFPLALKEWLSRAKIQR